MYSFQWCRSYSFCLPQAHLITALSSCLRGVLWLCFLLWYTSEYNKISMTNGMIVDSLSLAQKLGACKETDPSFLKFETVDAVYAIGFCLSVRSQAGKSGMADQKKKKSSFKFFCFVLIVGCLTCFYHKLVVHTEGRQGRRFTSRHPKQEWPCLADLV